MPEYCTSKTNCYIGHYLVRMKGRLAFILFPCTNLFLKSIVCLILVFQTTYAAAQSMRVISTKDGLPQSFVSAIVQDDSSFIWIGTHNGLARFDGVNYKLFQHNPYDSMSPASNLVMWMQKAPGNKLWIEYETGEIDVMDMATEKLDHFLAENPLRTWDRVRFIRRGWLIDSDGLFWGILYPSGINYYNKQKNELKRLSPFTDISNDNSVEGMTEGKDKQIWVLTNAAIVAYNKQQKNFRRWKVPYPQEFGKVEEGLAEPTDLHERANGEWMWGDKKNLFFFNPATKAFRMLAVPYPSSHGVHWIRTGPDGMEYLETEGRIYRYSDSTGLSFVGNNITGSLGDVKSFLVDRSGLIWVGTNAVGIRQIDLKTPFFESYTYKESFGDDMMLRLFGINMHTFFNWANDDTFSPSYLIRSATDKRLNRLYIALNKTVCYYDESQEKLIKLPEAKDASCITGITIMEDGSPAIVGDMCEVYVYSASDNSWKPLHLINQIIKEFKKTPLALDLLVDDKNFWITTDLRGLIKVDRQTNNIHRFSQELTENTFPFDQLLSMHADPHDPNILWIGSYEGLIKFDKRTYKSEVYSLKQGLPDNIVYSILSDRGGYLWFGTNKGLCRFDPVTKKIRVFQSQHGLPGDEFNRFHQLSLPNGKLVFGGPEGWTTFDPLSIKDDDFKPSIALTYLKVNNKDVAPYVRGSVLQSPFNSIDKLVLPYEQNTVNIGFAGLEFSQPQELQYRYMLEGYDKDWVLSGNDREASYTKIPPGNYTFLVNASNTSGKWSPYIKTIKVQITPPWWATRMAYLCYLIILGGLIYTFIRFRVRSLLMRQEMVLKEKETLQLKELDDMKSRFFSNITHEFRTPLTLIMAPAEQLKASHKKDTEETRLADTIINNAKQLLSLVNRLLDLSKLEAGALKLAEQHGSPASVVSAVVALFDVEAQTKQVQLAFKDRSSPMDCWFYADALERIVYNLISNALKFTRAGGKIDVSLSADGNALQLEVKDTGIGIPEKKLPLIFDRFYQAGGNGELANEDSNAGTGIGLSMVKELVTQMKGEIDVESHTDEPTGTRFVLALPYRNDAENDMPVVTAPVAATANIVENEEGHLMVEKETQQQILVVEDNKELAAFIVGILSKQYIVKHAINGQEGLELALSTMPDVIISDVMMPVMHGYEFVSRLKDDIRMNHIPVIMLTAKITKDNVLEGLTKGAIDYLTKPFHPTELMLRVQNLLASQQKLRERMQLELSSLPVNNVAAGVPEPEVQDIFLTKLYEELDNHMDDALFGVDQLVDVMAMSRSSLHRKLKNVTGMSTTEVIRNYRLKVATGFLKQGFSSAETAYKSGFGSPAYFTKCFREVYGVTPGDYVRQYKQQ